MRSAALAIALALAGCLPPEPTSDGVAIVFQAPPPPKPERADPRTGFVFMHGHWLWREGKWRWSEGRWERTRGGYAWVDGAWQRRGSHWDWVEGQWVVSVDSVPPAP
jgi:hypothetical protein